MSKFRIDAVSMLGLNKLVAPAQAPNAMLSGNDNPDTDWGAVVDSDHWVLVYPTSKKVETGVPQNIDLAPAH